MKVFRSPAAVPLLSFLLVLGCASHPEPAPPREPATPLAAVAEEDAPAPSEAVPTEATTASEPDLPEPAVSLETAAESPAAEEAPPEPTPRPGPQPEASNANEADTLAAQEAPKVAPSPPKESPPAYALTIRTKPPSARVRVMNIAAKYDAGMRLPPGTYDVFVEQPGYHPRRQDVEIKDEDVNILVILVAR